MPSITSICQKRYITMMILFITTIYFFGVLILHESIPVYDTSVEYGDLSFQQFSQSQQKDNYKTSNIWLAGIILNIHMIKKQVWDVMMELNCQHGIGIYIITKETSSIDEGYRKRDEFLKSILSDSRVDNSCGPFILHPEDETLFQNQNMNNRINKISTLRDYQRDTLKEKFSFDNNMQHKKNGIVILVDLDLLHLPSASDIWDQAQLLLSQHQIYPHDSICALGTRLMAKKKKKRKRTVPWYYDTYATVFWPDTFAHPLGRRLIPTYYTGEDPKLVRSNDQKRGNFTQAHMWNYFKAKGETTETGNVQVRSCFGGLAMYRSRAFFEPKCRYKVDESIVNQYTRGGGNDIGKSEKTIMRYASSKEKRPCEHVVFHDCLVENYSGFNIALNPRLETIWIKR